MRVTEEEAKKAVETLIIWAGDDPTREGLSETPKRVVNAYREWFSGYDKDPIAILERTFEDSGGYNEVVILKEIRVESYCEHHLVPIVGVAHVAYIPNGKVVGISKLARVVELYSKRMQIQEKLTSQIADAIENVLSPLAVCVVIEAQHLCMTTRGVKQPNVSMTTSSMRGLFRTDVSARSEVLSLIKE